MPAMRFATPSARCCIRGRTWLLAWLVGGAIASATYAQTAFDAAERVSQQDAGIRAVREAPDGSAANAPDLVAAERADPVAVGERLLKSNISEYGARSLQAAEAHLDLANAQREAK